MKSSDIHFIYIDVFTTAVSQKFIGYACYKLMCGFFGKCYRHYFGWLDTFFKNKICDSLYQRKSLSGTRTCYYQKRTFRAGNSLFLSFVCDSEIKQYYFSVRLLSADFKLYSHHCHIVLKSEKCVAACIHLKHSVIG